MKLFEKWGLSKSLAVADPIVAVEERLVESAPTVEPEPLIAIEPNRWKAKPEMGEESDEYMKVAASIGLVSGPVVTDRLLRCLRDNNIDGYSRQGVADFLDIKLGEGKWVWAGLRPEDCEHLPGSWYCTIGRKNINFTDKPYSRKIPLPVLLTVQTILKEVPNVYFYVSQSADENADPFLLVTSREIGLYIVERWDEPDFRDR